jgi:hypothetical protein
MVQVEGREAGTTIITAYADNGTYASCTVTVEAPYVPPVVEDPLKLNKTNIVIEEGEWAEIYVTGGRCVDWNTTNQNVVRIYDVGDPTMIKIKGESAGTAEVIAYAPDGTTTICKITVTAYQEPEYKVDSDPLYFAEEEPVYVPETEPVYVPGPETETDSENFSDFNADMAEG